MEVLIASNMDELDSKSSFDDSYKLFRCELGTFEIWKDNWGTLSIHSEDEKVIYFLGALFEEQGLKLV